MATTVRVSDDRYTKNLRFAAALPRKALHFMAQLGLVLVVIGSFSQTPVQAQTQEASPRWSPLQTIPGYDEEANPPFLIADGNNIVHAFASQRMAIDDSYLAITYNQWRSETGWTKPIDVLLSPIKLEARILDVMLDEQGYFHLIYFGGDETESYLYYAQVHMTHAGEAKSWSLSEPVVASMVPPSGAIAEDADGDIVIVFGGTIEGYGVYETVSIDRGETWSVPSVIGLTYSEKLFPYNMSLDHSSDGQLHALWQWVNVQGQGRGIIYSRAILDDGGWTDPIDLSEGQEMYELGTMSPAFIIHDDNLLALYNIRGKVVMSFSQDGGLTWTDPRELFSEHVGVNGLLSVVEDSGDQLHLFFGQRIPGDPDLHGMWHSVWNSRTWSPPDPIVSGPQVMDMKTENAFDPYDANATVIQGNQLLATWRSDPGLKGNGVWYAYRQIDVPALDLVPIPTEVVEAAQPYTVTEPAAQPTTPRSVAVAEASNIEPKEQLTVTENPAAPVISALIPVGLLIAAVFLQSRRSR